MTLKKLYMDLSKIIDDSSKTNSDILDKPIALYIAPCSDKSEELFRSGFYGVGKIEEEEEYIIITNQL